MAKGPVQVTVYDQTGSNQLDVGKLLSINNQALPEFRDCSAQGDIPERASSALARDVRQRRPHDLSRSQCTDDPYKFPATE